MKINIDIDKAFKTLGSLIDNSVNYNSHSIETCNDYHRLAYLYKCAINSILDNREIAIRDILSFNEYFSENISDHLVYAPWFEGLNKNHERMVITEYMARKYSNLVILRANNK